MLLQAGFVVEGKGLPAQMRLLLLGRTFDFIENFPGLCLCGPWCQSVSYCRDGIPGTLP